VWTGVDAAACVSVARARYIRELLTHQGDRDFTRRADDQIVPHLPTGISHAAEIDGICRRARGLPPGKGARAGRPWHPSMPFDARANFSNQTIIKDEKVAPTET
jgi:hypothetical protein